MPDKEMRIIAGKYRHRKIYVPLLDSIKPTKDRIREAIFSSLGDLSELSFLDLYSGSGAMGLEAISRGASYVAMVDNSHISMDAIKKNIKSLNISEKHDLYYLDDVNALMTFKEKGMRFDIIFLDPPYAFVTYNDIIEMILDYQIISPHGIIVVESNKIIPFAFDKFTKNKSVHYGDIYVTYLWR